MDNMHHDIWETTRTAVTDIIRLDLYSAFSGVVPNTSNFTFEYAMELLINRKLYLSDAYAI
jgi:hypothetical protein